MNRRTATLCLISAIAVLAFAIFLWDASHDVLESGAVTPEQIETLSELAVLDRSHSEPTFDRKPSELESSSAAESFDRDLTGTLRGEVLALEHLSPVSGAKVILRSHRSSKSISESTTTADGRFELEGIPAGSDYVVTVAAHGYVPARRLGIVMHAQSRYPLDAFLLSEPFVYSGLVVSDRGAPIVGALVEVLPQVFQYSWSKRAAFLENSSDSIAERRTDSQGAFALSGIPAGIYEVRASAEGFATRSIPRVSIAPGGSRTIELFAGNELRIAVQAQDGSPARSVSLVALRETEAPGVLPLCSTELRFAARTGDEGIVCFGGLEPGRYLVAWVPRLGQSMVLKRSIEVPHPAVLSLELPLFGSLVGTVWSPDGRTISDAQIVASGGYHDAMFAHVVFSDASGQYRVVVPAGAPYTLSASRPGTGGARPNDVPVLAPGVETTLDLHMDPGYSAEGRVSDAQTGNPIAGALVRIWQTATTTDAEGRYRLDNVRQASPIYAQIISPGYWSPHTLPPHIEERYDGLFAPYRIVLAPGVTQKDFAIRRAGALRGQVLDVEGAAVSSARVCVVREDDMDEKGLAYEYDSRLAETVTNVTGAFLIRELPSHAAIRVRVTHAGFPPLITEPMHLDGDHTKELVLQFSAACDLRGRVVDKMLEPLPGVLVSAFRIGQGRRPLATVISAPDGTFHLSAVPSGELFLQGTKAGLEDAHLVLGLVSPGERREELTLQLDLAHPLHGTILDERGAPISQAIVGCENGRDPSLRLENQTTGTDGKFSWPSLPTGVYVLRVQIGEGESQRTVVRPVSHYAGAEIKFVVQ